MHEINYNNMTGTKQRKGTKGRPKNNLIEISNKAVIGVLRLEDSGITIKITETEAILSRMYATNIYYEGCVTFAYLKTLVELSLQERDEDTEKTYQNMRSYILAFTFADSYAAKAEYMNSAYEWHMLDYIEQLKNLEPVANIPDALNEMALNNFAVQDLKNNPPINNK